MMLRKRFIFGLISLHLMMRCIGGNESCKASFSGTWACAPSWSQWGGKCYKAIMEPLTWSEAKDECIKMGGVFVAPQSQEESDFLMSLMSPQSKFWINCNDLELEGTWKCQDGTDEVEYRNWDNYAPYNYGGYEDCAAVWYGGKWNDLYCDQSRRAICKAQMSLHDNCMRFMRPK
ncbi:asialoglycoprotein receptor 2-like [Patiria miniata]|uniref:C-type lectin domain-containing protein n=1 Tax=Patiria miniata TaxID=46514 RepID=A0A913ZT48_PATMI|nr:asialoglycoprotein receptor 2-like [Patiria miniata]